MSGRICTGCGVTKPIDAFGKRTKGRDGRNPRCRDCANALARQGYAANPELAVKRAERRALNSDRYRATARERGRRIRAQAVEIHGGACVQCGSTDNLEFDHIDGGGRAHRQRESNLVYCSRIVKTGKPDPRLQILCGDCHAVKTADENAKNSPNAAKTHCPHGHPYDDANTYVHRGSRHCRACTASRTAERHARMRVGAVA